MLTKAPRQLMARSLADSYADAYSSRAAPYKIKKETNRVSQLTVVSFLILHGLSLA